MRYFQKLNFRDKINYGIAFIVLFFGLLSAVLVSRTAVHSIIEENKARGAALAGNLAARAVEPMLASDFLRLKNMVDETAALSDSNLYAFIQDQSGQIMAHTFKGGFPVELKAANTPEVGERVRAQLLDTGDRRIYDFAAPILVAGSRFGTARLGVSQAEVRSTVNRLLLTIIGITGGVGAASMLLGSLFARNVTSRINALRESAESVVKGSLDVKTSPPASANCWEIMDCNMTDCPAYGDERRRCWRQAGSLCPECSGLDVDDKQEACSSCRVYLLNAGDEIQSLAEAFDVMAVNLKEHIDELTRAQADIMRQQQLLSTILNVTPDMVTLQDEKLRYKSANKAFRDFFHVDEETVVGKTNAEVFGGDGNARALGFDEDADIVRTGSPLTKQISLTVDDREQWLHVIKTPVFDNDKIIGLLTTARDITAIKRYQDRLIQSHKMEDLGKLAGGVAHEINTPLGIILGYVQLLMEDAPKDSQLHSDLSIIEKQTKVCRKIVSDLLGFSRNKRSAMEPMDINKSLQDVVALVEHIFLQERVRIVTDLDDDLPLVVGDDEKLKQVWINLLNNAFDAVGSDGLIVVGTASCEGGRSVVVTVTDTGSGIAQTDSDKIFDPFFSTKPSGKGTGLGLSISQGIIGDHHGRISAKSPAQAEAVGDADERVATGGGPGTAIIIELPVTDEEAADGACLNAALRRANALSAEAARTPTRPALKMRRQGE